MKIALIGQDIPTLLPTLLTDLLFVAHEPDATVTYHEGNPAMGDVLQKYMDAIFAKANLGGEGIVTGELDTALEDADCVLFADDCMPGSRFRMDREALSGTTEEDPGLTDQARVNGGLGGLMHTLRCGEKALTLCEQLRWMCPEALIINLSQPMARITQIFTAAGLRCYGLGRTPLRGPNGLEGLCHALHRKADTVEAQIAGLPGFTFLQSLRDAGTGEDLLPQVTALAEAGDLGRLTRRWLDWYGAVAACKVTDMAEFLPAQPDFIPEEDPAFGETVEQRKERILHMNTVGQKGAAEREGMMAQLLLLSKAPAIRPMQLAMALLRGEDLVMPAVTRRNDGVLPLLPADAMIETALTLRGGKRADAPLTLPEEACDILREVDEANRLAAQAARGDWSAIRALLEEDPALAGLDRLYLQDLTEKLIELHRDVLPRFQ